MLNKLGSDTILNPANVAAVPKVLNSSSPKSPISMIIIPINEHIRRHKAIVIKANFVGLKVVVFFFCCWILKSLLIRFMV